VRKRTPELRISGRTSLERVSQRIVIGPRPVTFSLRDQEEVHHECTRISRPGFHVLGEVPNPTLLADHGLNVRVDVPHLWDDLHILKGDNQK